MTTVAVTGATGYLGGALAKALRSEGHEVVALARRPGPADRPFHLDAEPGPDLLKGVAVLVHAAWDLAETDPRAAWSRNVDGSRRLLVAAREARVERVVFVSSMSAYHGTRQDYGLLKLAVERSVLEAGGIVARPGLVYGPRAGGMVATLERLSRLPVVPVFPGARQFTAHVDDVLTGLAALSLKPGLDPAVVGLANEEPVAFAEIVRTLAWLSGREARTVPVPWPLVLVGLRAMGALGIGLPVRPDSLLGLVRPAPSVPGAEVRAALGLVFRRFPEGLVNGVDGALPGATDGHR